MAPTKYPFRFYGARPADWAEGANLGHAYEVRFVKAPGPPIRSKIARAFEETLADSHVATGGPPWQWCGDWAFFLIGERGPTDERGAFWEEIEGALRAVHATAPIAEVHFAGVTEAASAKHDAWSAWSVAQAAAPSLAPEWKGHDLSNGFYGEKQRRKRAKITTDAKFDAERAKWRPVDETADDSGDDDEESEEVGEIFLLANADRKALAIDDSDRVANGFELGKHRVVIVDDDAKGSEVHIRLGKSWSRVKLPHCMDRAWAFASVPPQMLFAGDGSVWQIDLVTAKPMKLGKYAGESESVGFSSKGCWVKSDKGTRRFDR